MNEERKKENRRETETYIQTDRQTEQERKKTKIESGRNFDFCVCFRAIYV